MTDRNDRAWEDYFAKRGPRPSRLRDLPLSAFLWVVVLPVALVVALVGRAYIAGIDEGQRLSEAAYKNRIEMLEQAVINCAPVVPSGSDGN